jgi:hypothetical protein
MAGEVVGVRGQGKCLRLFAGAGGCGICNSDKARC